MAIALAQSTTLDAKTFPASIHGDAAAETGEAEASGDDAATKSGRATPDPVAPVVAGTPPTIPEDDASLRAFVLAALATHQGNVSDVARGLGRTRMQIHRWMKRFAIDPETFRK